jgi:UDP-N-acetylmuramate-alanine ligase
MSFTNLKNNYRGKIHFIGIGGIGMSAIALILKEIGCEVQGSDLGRNNNILTMEQKGIKCYQGHAEQNINDDVVLVIKTSIVKENNPEIIAAKAKNIPIIRRADMLAQIMNEKLVVPSKGSKIQRPFFPARPGLTPFPANADSSPRNSASGKIFCSAF